MKIGKGFCFLIRKRGNNLDKESGWMDNCNNQIKEGDITCINNKRKLRLINLLFFLIITNIIVIVIQTNFWFEIIL